MTSLYVQVEHYSTGLYIQINKFLLKIIDLQYFPKETSLSEFTQSDLNRVAAKLNNRPGKTLGFHTPAEQLDEVLR